MLTEFDMILIFFLNGGETLLPQTAFLTPLLSSA